MTDAHDEWTDQYARAYATIDAVVAAAKRDGEILDVERFTDDAMNGRVTHYGTVECRRVYPSIAAAKRAGRRGLVAHGQW